MQPVQTPKGVVVLKRRVEGPFGPEQTFYLCGTSHVSLKSCDVVKKTIQAVKPQVVLLELCDERKGLLNPVIKDQKMSSKAHFALWKKGEQPLLTTVYSWMLGRVGDSLEVFPGEEFRVALEEALKVGAKVSLGDRLVSVTLARTWAALTSWQKVRFIGALLWMGVAVPEKDLKAIMEKMDDADSDVITAAIRDFGQEYPSVVRPLLEERDEYMVWMLRRLASQASTIVAVVGAGHLAGIQAKWDAEIDITEISQMPVQKRREGINWTRVILIASAGSLAVGSVVFAVQWRRHR